ncbi:MAG: histone family protein DNA-binding protein [Magnetococcales bacterium]|nr:histone family protein DNA-binding protein [Magnetococcales bacterium]HIJ84278.1 integration host factor subunit beta [Magnetococcales bacterium]
MTKSALINALSRQKGLSRKDAEVVVNTVFEEISQSLEDGNRVELRGFGSFGLKERRSRDGRNPKTGDKVHVDSKRVLFFKAGKELRERVDH